MDATAPDFVPAMSHSSAPPTLLTATMTCASEDPETTPAFKLCSGRGDTACVLVHAAPPPPELSCTVCLEAVMENPCRLRHSGCSHNFCRACIVEWLRHNRACPVCRAPAGHRKDKAEALVCRDAGASGAIAALAVHCPHGMRRLTAEAAAAAGVCASEATTAWVHFPGGCRAVVPAHALAAHIATCAHKPPAASKAQDSKPAYVPPHLRRWSSDEVPLAAAGARPRGRAMDPLRAEQTRRLQTSRGRADADANAHTDTGGAPVPVPNNTWPALSAPLAPDIWQAAVPVAASPVRQGSSGHGQGEVARSRGPSALVHSTARDDVRRPMTILSFSAREDPPPSPRLRRERPRRSVLSTAREAQQAGVERVPVRACTVARSLTQEAWREGALTKLCQQLGALREVDFSGRYSSDNKISWPLVSQALASNTSLHSVKLSGCELDDDAAVELAKGLEVNRSLVHLDLSGNRIGAEGGIALGQALVANASLRHVDLSGNHLGCSATNSASDALAWALRRNRTLRHLSLRGNGLCAHRLAQGFVASRTLVRLELDGARGALQLVASTQRERLDGVRQALLEAKPRAAVAEPDESELARRCVEVDELHALYTRCAAELRTDTRADVSAAAVPQASMPSQVLVR